MSRGAGMGCQFMGKEYFMKKIESRWNIGCRILRPMVVALGIAIGLSVPCVDAYPVVEVGPSLMQHFMNQFNTYYGRIQQAAPNSKDNIHWMKLLKEYQDALVKVQGIINTFGLPQGAELETVSEDYLVAETCNAGSPSLADRLKGFMFKPNGDWKAQQTQICVNIRMTQNRKYNDTVRFMTETVPSMLESLDAITSQRNGSSLLGNITATDSDSLRTANDLSLKAQEWEARMQAYDSYIAMMEANQKIIAQNALKGKPSRLVSDLAKTAALKGALSID